MRHSRIYRISARRRGFTLIELLTVVGIIALLVALATIGFNVVQKMAAGRSTHATHQNLNALVDEFGVTNGIGLITGIAAPTQAAPGDVSVYDSSHTGRYQSPWVVYTQTVMGTLIRVPKNRQSVLNFPSRQLLPAPYATTGTIPSGLDVTLANPHIILDPGTNLPTPPVILDAWHNPIIFVPTGGLTGITIGGQANQVVRSPDGRPFWASAGPDGDFSLGDDNIYSFEAR